MRRYEVRLTPSAMAQISDAVSYVRDDLGMPQAAAKLLGELEEAVMGLASLPNRFRAVDAVPQQATAMGAPRRTCVYTVPRASATAARFAAAQGVHPSVMMRLVGHENPNITMRIYTRVNMESKGEAMDAMQAAYMLAG